jgi:exosortase/archaeosortase family protein
MAQPNPQISQVTRTVVALVAVFGLLHLAATNDLLSNFTRPFVVALLKLLGVAAQHTAGELILGQMRVPWTRDCAGVNILTMLWAVTLWANRAEPFSFRYWLRLALAVPAALLANIARIFTLLAFRHLFFPSVESPQLHYFIGFLWIMPLLPLFVPRSGRAPGRYLMETLFLVVALSLVSPFVPAPGGNLVTLATLLLVAQSHYSPVGAERRWAATLWIIAAGFIALSSMESLWLPWLLLCPWFAGLALYRCPSGLMLAIGTIPLVAMHPLGRWVLAIAAIFELWRLLKTGLGDGAPFGAVAASSFWVRLLTRSALVFLLLLPFMASSLTGVFRPSLRPPSGAMSREVAANTFEIRLVGQPYDIQLIWYGPSGDGRHHTLPVCLRYRGIELKPSGLDPSTMTDGLVWMREFFIHRGELLNDYPTYLRRTLWPWSSAGVHVIASVPMESMGAKAFAQQCAVLAEELRSLGEPRLAGDN